MRICPPAWLTRSGFVEVSLMLTRWGFQPFRLLFSTLKASSQSTTLWLTMQHPAKIYIDVSRVGH